MTHFTGWFLFLVQDPSVLPDAPTPETQGEAYLIYFLGLAIASVIALFILNQKIHGGHKNRIRQVEEDHRKSLEENWKVAFETVQENNKILRECVDKNSIRNTELRGAIDNLVKEVEAVRRDR